MSHNSYMPNKQETEEYGENIFNYIVETMRQIINVNEQKEFVEYELKRQIFYKEKYKISNSSSSGMPCSLPKLSDSTLMEERNFYNECLYMKKKRNYMYPNKL